MDEYIVSAVFFMKKRKISVWELSLLVALCFTLCQGALAARQQGVLSDKIVRMHVVAASDAEEDQKLKMRVQSAVAEKLVPLLEGVESPEKAGEIIAENRVELLAAAAMAAEGEDVELIWGRESYGFRQTDSYSLPAGEYDSLRIIIGSGDGHNWWGVIFPQLDTGGYAEAAKLLDEEELALVYEEEGLQLRFRILEILQSLVKKLK